MHSISASEDSEGGGSAAAATRGNLDEGEACSWISTPWSLGAPRDIISCAAIRAVPIKRVRERWLVDHPAATGFSQTGTVLLPAITIGARDGSTNRGPGAAAPRRARLGGAGTPPRRACGSGGRRPRPYRGPLSVATATMQLTEIMTSLGSLRSTARVGADEAPASGPSAPRPGPAHPAVPRRRGAF